MISQLEYDEFLRTINSRFEPEDAVAILDALEYQYALG